MRPIPLEADLLLSREGGLRCGGRVRLRLEKESGIVGLCGPSGSGKSTLIRVLAGLPPRGTGLIRVDGVAWLDSDRGVDLALEQRPVSCLPQGAVLFPHMNVCENLLFAHSLSEKQSKARRGSFDSFSLSGIFRRWTGTRNSPLPDRLRTLVERFGIGDLLGKRPGMLSGGQTMKVALARAFLKDARLYLLDEPLTGIDPEGRFRLTGEVAALLRERRAMALWVTHTPGELSPVADGMVALSLDQGSMDRIEGEDRPPVGFDVPFGRKVAEWRR
jgi:ABC-type sulfate/molybdate transport systems ATPase subunit